MSAGSITALVETLVAAGATPEIILAAVRTAEQQKDAAIEQSRAKARARVQKWRDNKGETSRNVTQRSETGKNVSSRLTRGEDNLQTKKISGQEEKKDSLLENEFEREFWPIYPRKVGKRKALKAFIAARKRANLDEIMTGLRRYAEERRGEDQQYTKHPEGWLNGDHWTDEPAPKPLARASSPPHRETPFDALADISRLKGWTDEPGSLPGNNQDDQRIPPLGGGPPGPVVDLRRGHDWHS